MLTAVVIFSVILVHAGAQTADELIHIYVDARCAGNDIAAGRFQTNLNALLSTLNARAPISTFYNTTAGEGSTDRAYGLYMCEGDMSSEDCRNCVQTATDGILQRCPSRRQGIIWYEYCHLRFADYSFFGRMDDREGVERMNNDATIANPSLPLSVLSRLVDDAPSQPHKFAANASVTAAVYALAQCTEDLTAGDCRSCLQAALQRIRGCCSEAQGYRFLTPSCWVRYEATPFLRVNNSTFTFIIVHQCPNVTFPASSRSAFQGDLQNLLSSLATNSPRTGGFNTSVVGDGAARLYGLALCRADLANSTDACRTCLANATSSMVQLCPERTEGLIWYEQCELRYSNQSFFGVVDRVRRTFCNQQQTSQAYDSASLDLMARLVEAAPIQPLLFAAGSVALSDTESSYGLVQCTRDLTREDCRRCLTEGMTNVSAACRQRRGWRYLSGSCNLRYEKFPFFDASVSLLVLTEPGSGRSSKTLVIIIITPIVGVILLGCFIYLSWRRKRRAKYGRKKGSLLDDLETLGDTDLHLVDLETVLAATDNFSDFNKIGKGGFGAVYKGKFPGGEEIAIKRLSTRSRQGSEEFKNEVVLIAKLQHRNLVRTLGCCIDGEERILIYEYMPNGSLDTFVFNDSNRASLNWKKRFKIITGIARGLLYLHEDSQLKIIHRDLKPSNVLLDHEMNPKISDFGMAKIFRDDETVANTMRVVGTLGYMAPEYVRDGIFSVKSDVFSFGVLLLEILSGERNGRSQVVEDGLTLTKYAWQLWNEGRVLELVDPLMQLSSPANEVLRCIHIGLLCVQENPEARPTMSSVVVMLMSDQTVLPHPSRPPSFVRKVVSSIDEPSSSSKTASINEVSMTDIQPR